MSNFHVRGNTDPEEMSRRSRAMPEDFKADIEKGPDGRYRATDTPVEITPLGAIPVSIRSRERKAMVGFSDISQDKWDAVFKN